MICFKITKSSFVKEASVVKLTKFFIIIFLVPFAVDVLADYQLDNDDSSLNFISIKKNKIGEVHKFQQLSGSITSDGAAQVTIQLASIETNIGIRNERMKTLLFDLESFPTAVVSANLEGAQLQSIDAGDSVVMPVQLTLELNGKSKIIEAPLRVSGMSDGGVLVSTIKPVLLYATGFGLESGILKLMEVAKLPSIAMVVPVTFSLTFKPQ